MDEHRYEEWLALWSDRTRATGCPATRTTSIRARQVSIIYDDHDAAGAARSSGCRAARCWRRSRRPRMRRLVSNIEVEPGEGGRAHALARISSSRWRASGRSSCGPGAACTACAAMPTVSSIADEEGPADQLRPGNAAAAVPDLRSVRDSRCASTSTPEVPGLRQLHRHRAGGVCARRRQARSSWSIRHGAADEAILKAAKQLPLPGDRGSRRQASRSSRRRAA